VLSESNKLDITKFTKHKNDMLVYLGMYAQYGRYNIFEANNKVKEKLLNFLTLLKPILEEIENNGDTYALLLPYAYIVKYDRNTSKYEYLVEYAIINDTKDIEQKQISKTSTNIKFSFNEDIYFAAEIKRVLTKKSAKKKYILATNYPLYEFLRNKFAQDIANGELVVRSVYTVGLYYYISKMVDKDSINQNIDIDALCGNPNDNTKTFSRSNIKGSDDWLLANRSSLSMAGLDRNRAQAVLTLPEELIEGLTMFYGFQLNAPNIICKGTKQLVMQLLSDTSMYSNMMSNNDGDRYYAATRNAPPKVEIPEGLKPYVEIVWKIAQIVFENTPKNMNSFLRLVNNKIFDDLNDLLNHYIKNIGYEEHLMSIIKKKFNELKDNNSQYSFIRCVNYMYNFIIHNRSEGLEQITREIGRLAANIARLLSIKEEDYYKESLPLATLVHIYVHLVRYRDASKLTPKDEWKTLVTLFENIITIVLGRSLEPPPPQPIEQSGSGSNNTTTSATSTSPTSPSPTNPATGTSTTSSISSTPPNLPDASNQKSLNNNVYILPSGRFIECDLFDSLNAVKYCSILLPQDKYGKLNEDPLATIFKVMEYVCNFSGGIFSNVDQIYKLEEDSVPNVPVSFNEYKLTNLMIHTCDQRKDAIKILYRQARVDVEAIANNIALKMVTGQFSSNSNTNKHNEYFLNIIVFKSRYVDVDSTVLEELSKEFQDIVVSRVERMFSVLDDKDKDKVLKDAKDTYKFICNIHVVNEDDSPDLETILRSYTQDYCQNIVYMLDDHQQLHEMHLPLDEIQKYTLEPYHPTFLPYQILISKAFKMPLTGYAHYVIAYALNYVRPKNSATQDYKKRTTYRVLMNSKSFSHDYARLLAYVYLLFNIKEFAFAYSNYFKKISIEQELEYITKKAESETLRPISFSNKPYTVSLKAIRQFIDQVKSKTWYSYGFSRCNPDRKKMFEEYYEISKQIYKGFISSVDYQHHVHEIISACGGNASNAMDDNIGRVYLSILKPQEFSAINDIINQSNQNNPSYNMYFEKIKQYVEHVVKNINQLYNKFSQKLSGYDTPDIDYNIETKLLNNAFGSKGKKDMKAKLRFLDDLELDYIERIACITSVYMLQQLRTSFKQYRDWGVVLEAVFGADKLKTILSKQLEGLSEETYEKIDKLGKSLGLSNTEKVILIMNYLYLNRLYAEQYQDIEETFRVLTDDLLVTNVSEASIYRTQILIAGIRMFLQNFICDLYSKSKGNEFMDANRFSGNYLIICEDSDIAAALASSLSILLHFRSKTNKAMKEIELVARQFYSNLFKTLYKRNNKWYKRIKDKIIGTSKNKYYDEEMQFMDLTINVMNHALSTSEKFVNGNDFNSDYPLYGLSALVFILSIPLTVSLAMSVGDKDSANSMIGMVYKYQDAMSAHGITLSNSYCKAGYEQPELELPEDTELSHIMDFPVSTNIISKETIFDKDNYEDAITTISEVLTHRAKTMDQSYGQVIITDDITRVGVDMSNINTIIVLAGRRNTFSQSERQGALILDKQVADSLYEQTGRKANVYYVTFEYDSRIDDMTRDSYLKPRFNTNVQSLYSVMTQVSQIGKTKGTSGSRGRTSQPIPTVLTIAII
jgi:hypothetical protein